MGNCCSGDHPKAEYRTQPPLEVEERGYGPDDHPSPFMGTPDTMAVESDLEKSFLIQKSLSRDHHSSPSKEDGKRQLLFNPKLVPLLEFFSHLYVRKKDLFRRVISVHGEDLVEVLKKVGQVEERPRIQLMQRSRSLGANQDPKNERFKMVKTFKPDEGQPPSANSGAGTKPAGGTK